MKETQPNIASTRNSKMAKRVSARDAAYPITSGDRLLSIAEIAAKIGISTVSVYAWVNRGILPKPRKVGPRRVGLLASEVDAFLAGSRTAA